MPLTTISTITALFKATTNTVGVDIGSYAIKVIYLSGSFPNYKLAAWGYLPLEIESSFDQSPAELKNAYISKFTTFLTQNRDLPKDITLGVDGPSVIVRTISIPKLEYTELAKTIQFEAEPFLPVNVNDCELGFHIMGASKGDAKKMDVLLVAVKKEFLENKISIFSELGLRPVVVDCNALAVYNAYELGYKNPETVIILNIGSSITNMVIIENKSLKLVRDLAYGGTEFTKSIQRSMTVDFKRAEALKHQYGILVSADDKERTLSDDKKDALGVSIALSGPSKMLTGDIRRFIEFYLGQNQDAVINRILLSGGSANILNLAAYVSKETNIPTEIFNPLANIEGAQIIPQNVAPSMAIALGLATRRERDHIVKKQK